ncbi:hypothetical protein DS884_05255 [Tenacibaculum sp. E3R01]|uniref:hypothetical protein n=1 Tax=Tenacibaculum sp. E3R01 TaxID=2267227 RepID=UPI000DEA73BB|nr:hypothetical protein [Tenacibaculum sp. E3R01]RBW59158.1 hypothetical protein DS884_05255 [Tenacibaculum sp. E3R01]
MKTTNLLKIAIVLFGLSFLLWNCQDEQPLTSPDNTIKTVAINEALEHLNLLTVSQRSKNQYLTDINTKSINYQKIKKSNELLAVINAKTIYKGRYSRVLVLKVNDKIESVLFSMTPNTEKENKLYTGELLITDLSGNFINGYRVKKSKLVAQFVKRGNTKLLSRGETCPDHGECTEGSNCVFCTQELEEVVINSNSGSNTTQHVPVTGLYDYTGTEQGGNSGDGTMSWNFGSDGGGGSTESIVIESPESSIEDIEEYLKCFNKTKSAKLTIYVNQPIANNGSAFTTGTDKAGHAFISITQGDITRVYGFYPEGNASPYSPNGTFIFGNNENNLFDVSISFNINSVSLNNIINDANNYTSNYDLNTNNCTDFVIQTAGLCGVNLPDPQSSWLNGGGSNPGAFGQALRNMNLPSGMTRNTSGGSANSNNGKCN